MLARSSLQCVSFSGVGASAYQFGNFGAYRGWRCRRKGLADAFYWSQRHCRY